MLFLEPLLVALQCCDLLLSVLLYRRVLQQQLAVQAVNECHNSALRFLRHVGRRIIRRRRRIWHIQGRTEQCCLNLLHEVLPTPEWKKNLRMEKHDFMKLGDELRPYIEPSLRGPRDDVITVEKQLAITLYFLKDQGSLSMTANAFGVAICTVSVVVRKVCHVLTKYLGPKYIKLPSSEQDMRQEIRQMENKYGFSPSVRLCGWYTHPYCTAHRKSS